MLETLFDYSNVHNLYMFLIASVFVIVCTLKDAHRKSNEFRTYARNASAAGNDMATISPIATFELADDPTPLHRTH